MTRAQALADGLTDRDLRGGRYQRVLLGVYTLAEVELTHELKCLAAAMILPADSIITGRSAATLYGAPLADRNADVEALVTGHKYVNRRKGLRSWARKCSSDEYTAWNGIQLATPVRSAFDLLARNPIKSGVAYCDALLHADLVDLGHLAAFVNTRRYYGVRKARKAFELVDARAESIPESVLRVTMRQGGLSPTPQLEVFDRHGFVARLDLAFEAERVAVEYDGAWHGKPGQMARDQVRRDRLKAAGWYVIVVTADDLSRPERIVAQTKAALELRRS